MYSQKQVRAKLKARPTVALFEMAGLGFRLQLHIFLASLPLWFEAEASRSENALWLTTFGRPLPRPSLWSTATNRLSGTSAHGTVALVSKSNSFFVKL